MIKLQISQHRNLTSLDFQWDTNRIESFSDEADLYDIQAAKKILAKTSHPLIHIGFNRGTFKEQLSNIVIDKSRAKQVNVEFPLIFRTDRFGVFYLIDGWHRLSKIDQIGQTWVWAFMLSHLESRKICLPGGATYEVQEIARTNWWTEEYQIELLNPIGENPIVRFDYIQRKGGNYYLIQKSRSRGDGRIQQVHPCTPIRLVR